MQTMCAITVRTDGGSFGSLDINEIQGERHNLRHNSSDEMHSHMLGFQTAVVSGWHSPESVIVLTTIAQCQATAAAQPVQLALGRDSLACHGSDREKQRLSNEPLIGAVFHEESDWMTPSSTNCVSKIFRAFSNVNLCNFLPSSKLSLNGSSIAKPQNEPFGLCKLVRC